MNLPSEEELRNASLDDYIQWMLDLGRYDADLASGTVIYARFGRVLHPGLNENGYRSVMLSYSKRLKRRVAVHRVLAIKAWGVEAVRGKEVGHRNGNRGENAISNLWVPQSRDEHARADNSRRGLRRGPARSVTLACACCGDPGGALIPEGVSAQRISGVKFGIAGQLCRKCYDRLKHAARRISK